MNKDKLNPHIQSLKIDYLYHLGIDTAMDLNHIFGKIKYVIFTTSNAAAKEITNQFAREIYQIPEEEFSYNPIYKTERFHMYKIGVTIIISVGVGMPSLLIGLNEITRLFAHLGKYDLIYLKLSTSGGLGVEDGTVVISNSVVNGKFEHLFESIECGTPYYYPTTFDANVAQELYEFTLANGQNNVCRGENLSTHNFTDEQARMKGAIAPEYTSKEAFKYLNDAYNLGIRSIDMESLAFAGFCSQLEIQGCVIGISIVNRLKTEDIHITVDEHLKMVARFAKILAKYIQAKISNNFKVKVTE